MVRQVNKLTTIHGGNEVLKYPPEINASKYPFMNIKINERQGASDEGFVTDIYTYIPVGIFNNDGISYNNLERGLIGSGIEALSQQGVSLTQEDIMAAAGEFTSQASAYVGMDISGGYSAGVAKAGVALNPSAVTTFESTEIRQFDINLKFITNSNKESQVVAKIINRIREFMYPEQIGTFALQYPATFEIKFYSPGSSQPNPFMPIYMPAYCTGLQTTYNPSHASFHPDGAPVEVDCQLSFREAEQLTREKLNILMQENGVDISGAENEDGTTELSAETKETLETLKSQGKTTPATSTQG